MNSPRLSEREEILFKSLKKRAVVDIDDLAEDLKAAGETCRGGTRSLAVSVRYLGYKLGPRGFFIQRVSSLGRGNKAQYRLQRTGEGNGERRKRTKQNDRRSRTKG